MAMSVELLDEEVRHLWPMDHGVLGAREPSPALLGSRGRHDGLDGAGVGCHRGRRDRGRSRCGLGRDHRSRGRLVADASASRRLAKAREEIAAARKSGIYKHEVINDDLDNAVRKVVDIVEQECCKT